MKVDMAKKIGFTKAILDSLVIPDNGQFYVYDIKQSGLALRVSSRGKKTFEYYKKINGRPERIKIGPYPDLSIENARGKAAELSGMVAKGENPAEVKRGYKTEMTFADLFDRYMKEHSKPNKKTSVEDQQKYDRYLSNNTTGVDLARKKLSQIGRADISKLFLKISATTKPTANRVLALVSSVYGKAIEWGIWDGNNPCRGIKKNREKSRDRFLQGDEFPRFIEAVNKEENAIIRDFVLVSLLTGARRQNVLEMQWSQISWEREEWRIPETKNGTHQIIPLGAEVIEILEARKVSSESEYVFPGEGKTGHLQEPKRGWQRILEDAGIGNLRIHDLRRTMGSWQAQTGASLSVIGRSLNHKSVQTTAIYARVSLDPVRNSMAIATKAMLEAAEVGKGTQPESTVSEIDLSFVP